LTRWFAGRFARDLDAQSAMAALAEEAEASPPGSNGLLVLPYFSGERTPIHDPHAKGAILGLTLASTRADVYRALIEGIAFATNQIFETYAEAGAPPGTIQAIGGGLRNRIWTQSTSDVSGYAQVVRKVSIGAAYGDAFLAALALGDVSREAIKAWNPAASQVKPEPRNADLYRRRYDMFRELYERTKGLMPMLSL
jgi:xylulokinase